MLDYSWPGNVRQLESAIERAILLCEGDQITIEDLTARSETGSQARLPKALSSCPPKESVSRMWSEI